MFSTHNTRVMSSHETGKRVSNLLEKFSHKVEFRKKSLYFSTVYLGVEINDEMIFDICLLSLRYSRLSMFYKYHDMIWKLYLFFPLLFLTEEFHYFESSLIFNGLKQDIIKKSFKIHLKFYHDFLYFYSLRVSFINFKKIVSFSISFQWYKFFLENLKTWKSPNIFRRRKKTVEINDDNVDDDIRITSNPALHKAFFPLTRYTYKSLIQMTFFLSLHIHNTYGWFHCHDT